MLSVCIGAGWLVNYTERAPVAECVYLTKESGEKAGRSGMRGAGFIQRSLAYPFLDTDGGAFRPRCQPERIGHLQHQSEAHSQRNRGGPAATDYFREVLNGDPVASIVYAHENGVIGVPYVRGPLSGVPDNVGNRFSYREGQVVHARLGHFEFPGSRRDRATHDGGVGSVAQGESLPPRVWDIPRGNEPERIPCYEAGQFFQAMEVVLVGLANALGNGLLQRTAYLAHADVHSTKQEGYGLSLPLGIVAPRFNHNGRESVTHRAKDVMQAGSGVCGRFARRAEPGEEVFRTRE